jgi:hypothetical protein
MALLRWHRAALADPETPRSDGDPQCGWYRMRRNGGYWVPVEIYCDREIDEAGELTGPEKIKAEAFFEPIDPSTVWLHVEPISRADFDRLTQYLLANQDTINPAARINLAAQPTLPRR